MVYVVNTNLNNNKRVRSSLLNIPGLGRTRANQICDLLGIGEGVLLNQLTSNQIDKINLICSDKYLTGSELYRLTRRNKTRLGFIGCYRGVRQSLGLPLRGQRTHGNGRTARRGKRV